MSIFFRCWLISKGFFEPIINFWKLTKNELMSLGKSLSLVWTKMSCLMPKRKRKWKNLVLHQKLHPSVPLYTTQKRIVDSIVILTPVEIKLRSFLLLKNLFQESQTQKTSQNHHFLGNHHKNQFCKRRIKHQGFSFWGLRETKANFKSAYSVSLRFLPY